MEYFKALVANIYLTCVFVSVILMVQMFGGNFMGMDVLDKLKILADSAKYDVSCSSSGSKRQNTKDGIGNAEASGICHSFSADRKMHFSS